MEKHYLIMDKLAACGGMWSDLIGTSMSCLIPELSQRRQSYRVKSSTMPKADGLFLWEAAQGCVQSSRSEPVNTSSHVEGLRALQIYRALPRDLSCAFSSGSRADDASLGLLSTTMHCAAYKCCKSLGCFGWVSFLTHNLSKTNFLTTGSH